MHVTIADWITMISALVAMEMAIGHGTIQLTNAIPESWVPRVQAWCNLLAGLGSIVITFLSRFAAVLLAIAVLAAIAPPALAQDRVPAPRPKPLIPLPTFGAPQGGNESGGPVDQAIGGNGQLAKLLAKPFTDLASFIDSDAIAAAKLAIAIPDLQDGNGQQCWLAMAQFTAVLKAHPIPLTLDAMTDLQALRLAAMAANNVCKNSACTQVFADLANGIQQVAPINIGIPIPSLNSLCSKVPVVTVAPTVPMPQ